MKLAGRTALVTGAARGIGKGCALELARAGANVLINDRTETAQAQGVVDEIRGLGRKSSLIAGDAFERKSCESIVQRALDEMGRLDILVSNPAFSRRSDFLDYPPELFEKTLQGTLIGAFHMSQLVARHMVARGGRGKIVFISSVQSRIPAVRSSGYNAAKAGLNHFAFTIAAELLRYHINVNVIEPGWIDTPGEHEAFGSDIIRSQGPNLPWGRLGTPEDIGRAATFLASDDADYVTGTSLVVDGGYWLRNALPQVTT